jgi:magnesium-transporting ATPase (P-type)
VRGSGSEIDFSAAGTSLLQKKGFVKPKGNNCGMVVEGHSFSTILASPGLIEKFLAISKKSQAIIICRASPSQKASVVKMVRENMKLKASTTLSIGDGSNDVVSHNRRDNII